MHKGYCWQVWFSQTGQKTETSNTNIWLFFNFFYFFYFLPAVGLFLLRTESGLRKLQMLLFRSMLRLNLPHNFTRSHTLSTFYEMLQSLLEKRRMTPVLTLLRFMNWYEVDLELVVLLKSRISPSCSYFPSEIPVAQTHRPINGQKITCIFLHPPLTDSSCLNCWFVPLSWLEVDQSKAAWGIVRGQNKHLAGGFVTDLEENSNSWNNVF